VFTEWAQWEAIFTEQRACSILKLFSPKDIVKNPKYVKSKIHRSNKKSFKHYF
jgi:hypothetical protein